jgi:plasmid stabilization system protein ParE
VKVRWAIPAAGQLRSIFDYIAAGNPAAAGQTVRRIRAVILRTALMPHSGRIGRTSGTREILVPGTSYLIVHRIVEDCIHVLTIFDGAQQWPTSY